MNEIMANIKNRRSRRAFSEKSIADRTIEEILEAGRHAPSAFNTQPWKFVVISNKDVIKQLANIVRGIMIKIAPFFSFLGIFNPEIRDPKLLAALKKTVSLETDTIFYNAPLVILITAAKNAGRFAAKDCSLAAQNMMLYANSVGIGSCFVGRGDFLAVSKEAKRVLGLPPENRIHVALVFGYAPAAETLTIPERKKDNVIKWVR